MGELINNEKNNSKTELDSRRAKVGMVTDLMKKDPYQTGHWETANVDLSLMDKINSTGGLPEVIVPHGFGINGYDDLRRGEINEEELKNLHRMIDGCDIVAIAEEPENGFEVPTPFRNESLRYAMGKNIPIIGNNKIEYANNIGIEDIDAVDVKEKERNNLPEVGIVVRPLSATNNESYSTVGKIDTDFASMVVGEGGVAKGVLPPFKNGEDIYGPLDEVQINEIHFRVDQCNSIILQGGLANPTKYEEEVAKYAVSKGIPILAVCGGFNALVRGHGGETSSLFRRDKNGNQDSRLGTHIDIGKHEKSGEDLVFHGIKVDNDSLFAEIIKDVQEYHVNSIHGNISEDNQIPEVFKVVARAPDGLPEAVELLKNETRQFVLGLRWHPELMKGDERSQKIFKAFVDASNKN